MIVGAALAMICVDDALLHRHSKLGLRGNINNRADVGLQTRLGKNFVPFWWRWKNAVHRLGLLILGLVSLLVLLFFWVSQMASAAELTDAFLFLSFGDFGSGTRAQLKVAEQMAVFATELEIKFVTGLGDNFYETGIVNLEDEQLAGKFEGVYKDPSLTSIPWFMALGDHDHRGNVTAQVVYSQRSPNWKMPSMYFVKHICHGQGLTLDLVVTDSVGLEGAFLRSNEPRRFEFEYTTAFAGPAAGTQQLQWLKNTLKQSSADWLVVTGHRPLYSVASRHRYPVEHRFHSELMPLFKKYGVDVYLHGHDHVGQYSIRDGIVHIGNGVGGYSNQPIKIEDTQTVWSKDNYHGFCMHRVTKDRMVVAFIDNHGTMLHQSATYSKKKKRDKLKHKAHSACTIT